MLTLTPSYARLDIKKDEEFDEVSESIRALLQVTQLNRLGAALIVSAQEAFDWRSSLRIAIRFTASRGPMAPLRLALVTSHFNDTARLDVLSVARECGIECEIFRSEGEAVAWVSAAAPSPAESRR